MSKRYSPIVSMVNFLVDTLLLNVSFVFAFYWKHGEFYDPFLSMLMYINLTWLFVTQFVKPYKISRVAKNMIVFRNHFIIIFLHLLFVSVFYVVQSNHQYSRALLSIFYIVLVLSIFFWKTCYVILLKYFRQKGYNYRNLVIVNQEGVNSGLHEFVNENTHFGYKVAKEFYANNENIDEVNTQLKEFCTSNEVDEILYSINSLKYGRMNSLVQFAEDNFFKFKLVLDFEGFVFRGVEVENFGHLPILNIVRMPLDYLRNIIIKRIFDVVFSIFVILFLLSWLFPVLFILIKIDSKGSVLFKQKRTGKDNLPFWCLKLRTMHSNEESGIKQATRGDSRVTKIGGFLRKTSLDELPQFFNVLIGQMSVVGPRPHMLLHTEEFADEIDQYMVRQSIKPGITGLAQARGFRGETKSFESKNNRVKMDRFYLRNWSFVFDIIIIFETILDLFKSKKRVY